MRPFQSLPAHLAWLALLVLMAPVPSLAATKETVCTITVNSPDEKEAFRRHLPPDRFRFVELVERGRPDWLASARRNGVRCDFLVISGHYDGGDYAGGNEFFSEHPEAREFLSVDEMERVACSEPDAGPFAHLKAVYLFGCNTLNPEALRSSPAEIARTLVQSGHAPTEAERLARAMSPRFADSSRDRMRHIFRNVPVIYGFSSTAPLGPTAATYLDRYLRAGGTREIASGHPTNRILGYFPGRSLTSTRGSTDVDPDAGFRRDVCQFLDDRLSPVERAQFVHRLLGRDMAEVRLFLDRLERYVASLRPAQARTPEVATELAGIAGDTSARSRYLAFMQASSDPRLRVRMIDLGAELGWLSPDERLAALGHLVGDLYAHAAPTAADVDLVCKLNADNLLSGTRADFAHDASVDVPHAAILGCLGSTRGRAQVLRALTSPSDGDAQVARTYLRHRPIADINELRVVTAEIARMSNADSQVRALAALADHRLSDPEALAELVGLFPTTSSIRVQRAIAGVLIRSDYRGDTSRDLLRTLREHRLKSPDGRDLIDVLIDQLEAIS
ncbi:MAG: hypothetical protein ACM3JC_07155 [Rudaea sp.]